MSRILISPRDLQKNRAAVFMYAVILLYTVRNKKGHRAEGSTVTVKLCLTFSHRKHRALRPIPAAKSCLFRPLLVP